MSNLLIAIDPGKNGGIAEAEFVGGVEIMAHAISMPETAHDLVEYLESIQQCSYDHVCCVVERVHSMPQDGAASAFAFGENFGMLQGVLAAVKIPYRFVTPQQWQKKVGALPKDKAERKRALKAFAQQRYPKLKVTLKTADALAMLAVEGATER